MVQNGYPMVWQPGEVRFLDLSEVNGQPRQRVMVKDAGNVFHVLEYEMIETAEAYNEPGRFTALIGFEWTSLVEGGNMHRNVIFRDNGDRASRVVPFTQTPPFGSSNLMDLYAYLEEYLG